MSIANITETELSQVAVFGPDNGKTRLWALEARAQRVPDGDGDDGDTPGVHSLRSLWVRSVTRKMRLDNGKKIDFSDTILFELFAKKSDAKEQSFRLKILGLRADVALSSEQRVDVAPAAFQPSPPQPSAMERLELLVPSFALARGSLLVQGTAKLGSLLPLWDATEPVELCKSGVHYSAKVEPPDGSKPPIASSVLLAFVNGAPRLVLVPDRLSAKAAARWRDVWRRMNELAQRTRDTAWARLNFVLDAGLPALSWPLQVGIHEITVKWEQVELPGGLVSVTLADQPIESQLLGPEAVMAFTPSKSMLTVGTDSLKLTAGSCRHPELHYAFIAPVPPIPARETLKAEGQLKMLHRPAEVRAALDSAYAPMQTAPEQASLGFLRLDDGWMELPFTPSPALAPKRPRAEAKDARGSVRFGLRRAALHMPDEEVDEVPWSVQIDEPASFELSVVIAKGKLSKVDIAMRGCALSARGLLWLAGRAPDGDDALPRIAAHPSDFFDLALDLSSDSAPFVFENLELSAPQKKVDWDSAGDTRPARQPSLKPGLTVSIDVNALGPPVQSLQRLWCRHPSLPSIQTMAQTRSDLDSPRPHASRCLSPFERTTGRLILENLTSMAPHLSAASRAGFTGGMVAGKPPELAVLSLPGIELIPEEPLNYQVTGSYDLPLIAEPSSRASVPPPAGKERPPALVVTALQPLALAALSRERARLRALATSQLSRMFGPGALAAPLRFIPGALAEPRSVKLDANVSSTVTNAGGRLQMGAVTFLQPGTQWSWSDVSGDELLRGPEAALDFAIGGQLALGTGNGTLRGWSVAERSGAGRVVDGRGLGWGELAAVHGALMLREVDVEQAQGRDLTRLLLSTIAPVPIALGKGTTWQLALTDIPLTGKPGIWRTGAVEEDRLAALERGWTWALFTSGAKKLEPLPLGRVLFFSPAALTIVELDNQNHIAKAEFEGALTLGNGHRQLGDSRNRVSITCSGDGAGGLTIDAITALNDKVTHLLAWDLEQDPASHIAEGMVQLSAKPVIAKGDIALFAAVLEITLFSSRVVLPLGDLQAGEITAPYRNSVPVTPGVLKLTKLDLDLKSGQLAAMSFSALLSPDVELTLSETGPSRDLQASLNWYGNTIKWEHSTVKRDRRSIALANPQAAALRVFPGVDHGGVDDGVLCLALAAYDTGKVGFPIAAHYAELLLSSEGQSISHLLHSNEKGEARSEFRFDGEWKHPNLVAWPALAAPSIGAGADSVDVEFGTTASVRHLGTFLLSDHRLLGTQVGAAAGGGLALREAVNWLVEATHTLTWNNANFSFQCLHALQLWSGDGLKKSLAASAKAFGFTPSYLGAQNGSVDFPLAGVRRIGAALSGIFEPGGSALQDRAVSEMLPSGDGWILLGGVSALCPTDKETLFQPLHLAFIGALGFAGADLADLIKRLAAPPQSPTSRLKMSRHDVLPTQVRVDLAEAMSVGGVAGKTPGGTIDFLRAASAADSVSGAALAAGWFGADGKGEPGWHVEQIQLPGRGTKRPVLPYPFPRAAVMLAHLRAAVLAKTQPALSVVVRFTGTSDKFAVDTRTVRGQPPAAKRPPSCAASRTDLVVGSEEVLLSLQLGAEEASYDTQLMALAMTRVREPAFLVVRRQAGSNESAFSLVGMADLRPDPLRFTLRPLRAAEVFATDGRLTWPEPQQLGDLDKNRLDVVFGARTPFQDVALGLAGRAGALLPARMAGDAFQLRDAAPPAPDVPPRSVWLQEWERIAFAAVAADPEDAMPVAFGGPVAAMPMAPSAAAIGAALARMDAMLKPTSLKSDGAEPKVQTYLPPWINNLELSNRTGTMVETGVRALWTWDDGARRAEKQAFAGPAATRGMRLPRPAALPPVQQIDSFARRTVAWYGRGSASCLALPGVWDMLVGEPDVHGMPAWCVLLGKPARAGLVPVPGNQQPLWSGALEIACIVRQWSSTGGETVPQNPTAFVLALLRQQLATLRTGLRHQAGYLVYTDISVAADRLRFSPPTGGPAIVGDCMFECGLAAPLLAPALPHDVTPIKVPPAVPRGTLDDAGFRKLELAVIGAARGVYALPLTRRSIFFSDPAYDRSLSHVQSLAENATGPGGGYQLWIDRPSVGAAESIVVVVFGAAGKRTFSLSAAVRRKDAPLFEDQFFVLEPQGVAKPNVMLDQAIFYTLPLSALAGPAGAPIAAGDLLRLEALETGSTDSPARLFVPVQAQSALAAPQALYSLIAVDVKTTPPRAWCALHSGSPRAESLTSHAPQSGGLTELSRRAVFKWAATDVGPMEQLGFSVCKTEVSTDSMHIPDTVEPEGG